MKSIKALYPHIDYRIVLAYLPKEKQPYDICNYSETVFPEGLESVLPRFAIDKRNRWMIEQSDYVITYVNHSFGGAAKYKEIAERKGKTVLNINPPCV